MDYEVDDDDQPEEGGARKSLGISKPLIGVAICLCLFLVSILLSRGEPGFNLADTGGPLSTIYVVLFVGSIAGGIGCAIWMAVVLLFNAFKN